MASIRKIKDRFYLLYRDDDGKQKSKPLGKVSRREAERQLLLFDHQPVNQSLSFEAFCFEYVRWHAFEYPASHNRVAQIIEQHLFPVFGYLPLDQVTIERGEEYKRARAQVVSSGSLIKEIRTLKAILNKAVEWGRIDSNPLAYLKPPKDVKSGAPPFYTVDQLNDIYAVCSEYDAAIWRFMANTGLRRGEMLNLRVEDVRQQGIYVVSREGARTKSGKFRVVPWADGSREASEVLLRDADKFVLDRINGSSLSRKFAKTVKRAGQQGSLHWLRHTFGSHLVMNGVPLRVVQQVMGHSTIAVTEQYSHLEQSFIGKQINALAI